MASDSFFFIYLLVSGLMLWTWKGGRDKALPIAPWLRTCGSALAFVVIALQVVYGLLDFGSGLLREWIGTPGAFAGLRNGLAFPPLSGFIVATDFLTTAWIYVLFAKLVLSEDSSESSYFGLSASALAVASTGIRIQLLVGALRLFLWQEIGTGTMIAVLAVEVYVLIRLIRSFSTPQLAKGHSRITLLLVPILLPILEPLLGNAFQFAAFAALIIAAARLRHFRAFPSLNLLRFTNAIETRWSRYALAYLLSLGFPALIIFSPHLTFLPPLQGQFERLMLPLGLMQLVVILLSIAILRADRYSRPLTLAAIAIDLIARVWLIPQWIEPAEGTFLATVFSIDGLEAALARLYFFQFFLQGTIFYILRFNTGFSDRDFSSAAEAVRSVREAVLTRLGLNFLGLAGFSYLLISGYNAMIESWNKQLSPAMIDKLLQSARETGKFEEAIAVSDQLIIQAHTQYVALLVGIAVLAILLWQIGHDSPFKVNREAYKALAPEEHELFRRAARRNPINLLLQIIPTIVALAVAGLFAYYVHANLDEARTELNERILELRGELVELYEEDGLS